MTRLVPLPRGPMVALSQKDGASPGTPLAAWHTWLESLQMMVQPLGSTGTTAARPISGLYIGMQYFDTTLGLPVFVKAVSPAIVWVNGAGAVV